LQSLEGDVIRDAAAILASTADEATIAELAGRLESAGDWQTTGDLIICLQACLGLPEFRKGGICGNSSQEEYSKFIGQEERRTEEAKRRLMTWLAEWQDLSSDQRSVAVVSAWQDELQRTPGDYESLYFASQVTRYRNLLRRGPAMLPAVQAVQSRSSDLTVRGGLEFFKAFWTGQCDAGLVSELLDGNFHQQMIACDIIAAAIDTSWKDQLAELLREQEPPSDNLPAWVRRVDKAVETLVMCHDVEALPLLKPLQPRGFDSVRYAVQHFEVPAGGF
jgi:hypothetical protein